MRDYVRGLTWGILLCLRLWPPAFPEDVAGAMFGQKCYVVAPTGSRSHLATPRHMAAGVSDPQVLGTIVLSSTALMSLIMARVGRTSARARTFGSGVMFTDDMHASLVVAMREALSLKSSCVDTEHLLLGILTTGGGHASAMLSRIGANPSRLHDRLLARMSVGHGYTSFDLPYSHRAFRVLDEAVLEALALGHKHAGPEHVILGILRVRKSAAARALLEAGVTLEAMRREVARSVV